NNHQNLGKETLLNTPQFCPVQRVHRSAPILPALPVCKDSIDCFNSTPRLLKVSTTSVGDNSFSAVGAGTELSATSGAEAELTRSIASALGSTGLEGEL
ncbi:hypothetical protein, partial [Candidatus Finniella inopinata]|uniref:hypothetical protein n=1 Tax=Candidatus Finniella inopinata TaxID=1696036 RepID=UPI001A912178